MSAKGYVVRGTGVYCVGALWARDNGADPTPLREKATRFRTLNAAAGATVGLAPLVTIFAVAEDGTETPLPSYEEALAEIGRLRAENEAQRFRAVEAEAAAFNANEEIERLCAEVARLRRESTLTGNPEVLRHFSQLASGSGRAAWEYQVAAELALHAAEDVDVPEPLKRALGTFSKLVRFEPLPPEIARSIHPDDAEDVRVIGRELLTCALCWDPKARPVGNLTAAQIADAAVAAMMASGLTGDEACRARVQVVEKFLRDAQEALHAAACPAEDGEPIVDRVRGLAHLYDVERGETKRLRAEIAHLKAHAATLPIALAPVPPGDTRPAVLGGECSACLAAPPYHEAKCRQRTALAHDLTPSTVALAKVLAAWEAWPGRSTDEGFFSAAPDMAEVHETLFRIGLISPGIITAKGRNLLECAQRAGVLSASMYDFAAERAAWARLVASERAHHRQTLFLYDAERDDDMKGPWAAVVAAEEALCDLGVDVDVLIAKERA